MKVFNQSRKEQVPGKRFQKYLLYALGEIVLVVAGILIAVSINNSNERRKEADQLRELAEVVRQQMVVDSLNLDEVLRAQERRGVLFDKILRETPPNQPIVDCPQCPVLTLTGIDVANMNIKVRTLLERSVLKEDSLSVILYGIEADYKHYENILTLLEDAIVDNLKENVIYLRDEYDWFAGFISRSECPKACEVLFL